MWLCKYCQLSYNDAIQKANHMRWCHKNPLRDKYVAILNDTKRHETIEAKRLRIDKMKKSISMAWKNGKYDNFKIGGWNKGKPLSLEHKQRLSETLRSLTYQRVCKSTQYYKGVKMDSSYEVRVATILDTLNIKWIRPEPLIWIDSAYKQHHYFPDFYCQDYDVYLDPKNDYCFKQQHEKIEYILNHYNNVLFLTKDQINIKTVDELVVKWISRQSSKL